MQIDENPLFRKMIVPWYDAEAVCFVTVVLMELTFGFGVVGLSAVRDAPQYHRYIWLPWTLISLSLGVVLSITIRLIRRYTRRRKKRKRISGSPGIS